MEVFPGSLLRKETPSEGTDKPDLLILNLPIADLRLLEFIWPRTGFKLCADGAANHLFEIFSKTSESRRCEFVSCSVLAKTCSC